MVGCDTLYKVIQTFKFVDETFTCHHSNETFWEALAFGAAYYAV